MRAQFVLMYLLLASGSILAFNNGQTDHDQKEPVNEVTVQYGSSFYAGFGGDKIIEGLRIGYCELNKPYSVTCEKRYSDGCLYDFTCTATLRLDYIEKNDKDGKLYAIINNTQWFYVGGYVVTGYKVIDMTPTTVTIESDYDSTVTVLTLKK